MDIFKQNWVQRIKTEPYTNIALNTDRNITYYEQKIGPAFDFNEITTRWCPTEEKRIRNRPRVIHFEIERDGRIEQNTRPPSLYNLRYARRQL